MLGKSSKQLLFLCSHVDTGKRIEPTHSFYSNFTEFNKFSTLKVVGSMFLTQNLCRKKHNRIQESSLYNGFDIIRLLRGESNGNIIPFISYEITKILLSFSQSTSIVLYIFFPKPYLVVQGKVK